MAVRVVTPLALIAIGLHAQPPDFDSRIRPVLSHSCLQCHSAQVRMGGLDLSTPDGIFRGGSKGPAVKKGDAAVSLLYTRVAEQSMPPGKEKLTREQAALIRAWIDAGAPVSNDASTKPSTPAASHWAFQSIRKPAIPAVKDPARVRTPVDAFLLAALESKGIQPVSSASPSVLLRRMYLDVTGLPPSREEQSAFLADPSPAAADRVVESLLGRPQYGERWARHWLDVVRYAESNGYERDGTKPNVWRYRDWVIRAFNSDKPYDRFLTEQLAGDEIPDSDAGAQIATTFLRLGTWDDEPAEPQQDRYDQLDDVLGVTSATFLGITLRCARCHDHKFEPFSQKDYYRTLAIFDPLKRPQDGRKEFDRLVGREAELAAYNAAKEKADAEVAKLRRQIETSRKAIQRRLFSGAGKWKPAGPVNWLEHAEIVLALSVEASKRNKKEKELAAKFESQLDEAIRGEASDQERTNLDTWKSEIAAIDAARPPEPPRAYIWYEDGPRAPETRLLVRGDPARPGDPVEPGVPAVLGSADATAIRSGTRSTGRRLWLANWLTSRDNPLTARVIVNRLWQWHFGEGLVPSENDFGVNGQRPVNQALLDYLAAELIDSGWSLKHIQRLILRSNAFRRSSEWDQRAAGLDPENKLLWRWQPRRLEAETVRDATLAVSGRLNPQPFGPSVFPKLPRAVLEGQSRPGLGWGESKEDEASRRSVYIFIKRSLAVPELEMLDSPDTTSSCEQRPVSTTGPQALAFLNGDFTRAQAGHFAARLIREGEDTRQRVTRAFQLAVGRDPSAAEADASVGFLERQAGLIEAEGKAAGKAAGEGARKAIEAFALVMLNSNEFFYLN